MDRRLGRPLPHQLPNPTRADPSAINLSSVELIRYYSQFPGAIPNQRARSHALLTRPPLSPKASFDLHVLGLPPAFNLSQDQTLHLNFSDRSPSTLSAVVSQAPITRLHLHALNLWFLLERLQYGQPSTRQTPAQVTCAHCQRSSDSASAPHPVLPLNPPQKRPSEPHIIGSFSLPSTPF